MIRALLALFLAALPVPALAAEIYVGRIGEAEVVVLLRRDGREVQGTYAYRSQGRPLALSGPNGDAALHLTERVVGASETDPPTTGHWRLTRVGPNWSGDWRARPGAPARYVRLRRIASTEPDSPAEAPATRHVGSSGHPIPTPSERLPYMLELARAPVSVGADQTFGAGAFQLVEDPRTGVSWPRLTRHADPTVVPRLNAVLEENRAIAIDDTQDCWTARPGDGPRAADPTAPHARVTFLGRRLITLEVDGSLDCGGAPNAFHRIVHYDTRTGALLDPASLLRLGLEVEQERFRSFWMERLRARIAAGDALGDCYDPESVPGVAYRVTAAGLVVERGIVASMDIVCAVDLIEIPLDALRPYLRSGAAAYWD